MAFVDPGDLTTAQVVTETWMDTARLDLLDLDTRVTTAQSTANTGVTNAATADAKAGQAARWALGATTPAAKPMLLLGLTSTITVATATDLPIGWHTALANTNLMTWSAGSNPSQITITRAGIYTVSCRCSWASNATARRAVHLSKNGAGFANFIFGDARVSTIANDEAAFPSFSHSFLFAVNDVLRFEAWQSTGGNLNLENANLGGTKASIVYEGPIV